jgi:hypothetical protein
LEKNLNLNLNLKTEAIQRVIECLRQQGSLCFLMMADEAEMELNEIIRLIVKEMV